MTFDPRFAARIDEVRTLPLRDEHKPACALFRGAVVAYHEDSDIPDALESYGYTIQHYPHAVVLPKDVWEVDQAVLPSPAEVREGEEHVVLFYTGKGAPPLDAYPELEGLEGFGAFPAEWLFPAERIPASSLRHDRALVAALITRHRVLQRWSADVAKDAFAFWPRGWRVLGVKS